MPRTTLNDLARKARIREREARQFATKLRKLDNITDEQLAELKKIKAAEANSKPVKGRSIADWQHRNLHELPIFRGDKWKLKGWVKVEISSCILAAEGNGIGAKPIRIIRQESSLLMLRNCLNMAAR